AYNFVEGSAEFEVRDEDQSVIGDFDFDTAGFTRVTDGEGADKPGTLIFPATWTNDNTEPRTFVARITVWVDDADPSNPAFTPDLPHPKKLSNTARFGFTNPNTGQPATPLNDTADTVYIEPNVAITKTTDSRT